MIIYSGGGQPLVRAVVVPRFKTSGLSGDEWRTSVSLEVCVPGDQPFSERWLTLDSGTPDMMGALCRLPVLANSLPDTDEDGFAVGYEGDLEPHELKLLVDTMHDRWHTPVNRADFLIKGVVAFSCDAFGGHRDEWEAFETVLGHMPWLHIVFGEEAIVNFRAYDRKCSQYGCSKDAAVAYRLEKRYSHKGTPLPDVLDTQFVRMFCERHARRGDCGIEDRQSNYTQVYEGLFPRPEEDQAVD